MILNFLRQLIIQISIRVLHDLFFIRVLYRITTQYVELFSWKTTSHKDHLELEVCLPNSRLLSGLIGMWSCMKITLNFILKSSFPHFKRELLCSQKRRVRTF